VTSMHTVACRVLVMPRANAWLDAPLLNSSIEWRLVVIVTGYMLFVTSQHDVILRFTTNVLAQHAYLGTVEQQWAEGAVKQRGDKWKLIKHRQWKTYKTQKNFTNYVCLCSSTMLTSKITEIMENNSKFSAHLKSCNKFVWSRSW